MKSGRELLILTSVLFILIVKLPGSVDSLPFYLPENMPPEKEGYVEIVEKGRAALFPLDEVRGRYILQKGGQIEVGDSLHVTGEGIRRGRMKGGHLLLLGLPINVNKADASDLMAISGIGPRTAEAIITFRENEGPFRSLSDLLKVRGIGRERLAKMEPFLTI